MSSLHQTLRNRVLRLLAQRDYTRVELVRKLHQTRIPPSESANTASHDIAAMIQSILDECEQRGWLNHQRYAETWSEQHAARHGRQRLQYDLSRRGIARHDIEAALAKLPSEYERATQLWQRKFGIPPKTPQDYARQMRFLATRGFTRTVAQQIIPRPTHDFDESPE